MYLDINIIENFVHYFSVFTTLDKVELLLASLEIFILAFITYKILMWIKNTRAWVLLRGVVIILIFALLARALNFKVIFSIVQSLSWFAALAIIILFQDDLKSGLEHLGRQRVFNKFIPNLNKFTKKTSHENLQEIVEASFAMGKVKTGALIVIEQEISLEDVERTGIIINAEISRQLIINIFEKNTPLHDGALLIVGNTIKSATCYLPLSRSQMISKDLGTRHRAALGISEISDSITIVVSEETGSVSTCYRGERIVAKDEKELLRTLIDCIYGRDYKPEDEKGAIKTMRGWFNNDEKY